MGNTRRDLQCKDTGQGHVQGQVHTQGQGHIQNRMEEGEEEEVQILQIQDITDIHRHMMRIMVGIPDQIFTRLPTTQADRTTYQISHSALHRMDKTLRENQVVDVPTAVSQEVMADLRVIQTTEAP